MILCNFMNKMTLTYLIALGIIAVLSIASYVTLKKDISSQETNAAVINLTSKQRFLTQNIAIHSLCLVSTNDSAETEALRQYRLTTIHTIETVHKGLISGDPSLHLPGRQSPQIHALYFEPLVQLYSRGSQFVIYKLDTVLP
ncbi:MAG: hypothetical protein B6D35_03730 [Candidatus Brocadia sp. UTAMX2]|nr:MAG: hypothetical protein B6D35_03730 [Candidatus Brocadia sp. UTAMX2]